MVAPSVGLLQCTTEIQLLAAVVIAIFTGGCLTPRAYLLSIKVNVAVLAATMPIVLQPSQANHLSLIMRYGPNFPLKAHISKPLA